MSVTSHTADPHHTRREHPGDLRALREGVNGMVPFTTSLEDLHGSCGFPWGIMATVRPFNSLGA